MARRRATIILPVYNEYRNLKKNFPKIYRAAKALGSFEIIIAEDGSTDGSRELAQRLSLLPDVVALCRAEKSGRGGALKRAIRIARGNVVGYMDIDLSVPLSYLPKAVEKVEDGNAILTGSRYVRGASIKRTVTRHFLSAAYNALLFLFFRSQVKDHQCGFKFLERGYARKLAGRVRSDHWFFDTEMLILAQRDGIMPYELPVRWKEHRETKVRGRDVYLFAMEILRLRFGH